MHACRGLPNVIDIRNIGLVAGDRVRAARRKRPARAGGGVFQRCFDRGVLVRTTGDIIALSPPLIIEKPTSTASCRSSPMRSGRKPEHRVP